MRVLHNGVHMPEVGFGTYGITEYKVIDTILTAIDTGYRLIDTATLYNNEHLIGEALKRTTTARSELFVTTKLWEDSRTRTEVREAFFKSLRKLQLDYLDLYLVHWPQKMTAETWQAMEELYEEGLVRAIGVANFHQHHLTELFKSARIKPMVNQVERHPYLNQSLLQSFCNQYGIVMQAWSPLARNRLKEDNHLQEIANHHARSISQVILRWHYQTGFIAIPKSETPERIRENFDIFDFNLNEHEIEVINKLDRNQRIGANPDFR